MQLNYKMSFKRGKLLFYHRKNSPVVVAIEIDGGSNTCQKSYDKAYIKKIKLLFM